MSYSSAVGGGSGGTTTPPPAGGGATVGMEAIYFHHNDHLGTPQALTDINGTKVWEMSQTPFGIATVNEDPDGDGLLVVNNFRFPGQYYDAEIGLNYNYFRTFDPILGRYTQSDPIGLVAGLNTFSYVNGDPVYWTDKFGLFEKIVVNDSSSRKKPGYGGVVTLTTDDGKEISVLGSRHPNPSNPSPGVADGSHNSVYRDKGHQGKKPGVRINNGLPVPTKGENPAQNNNPYATGINIHCGYSSTNRGSAGCITIKPSDCKKFFGALKDGETGRVIIK